MVAFDTFKIHFKTNGIQNIFWNLYYFQIQNCQAFLNILLWIHILIKCIRYNLTSTSVQAFALHLYWFCGSRVVVPIFLWFFGFISFTHRFLNRFCDLFFLFNPISRGLQISVLYCKKYVLAQRYHILSFVLFFVLKGKKPKIYFSQGYHYVCVPYNWAVSDNYNSQVFNTTLKSWT